MAFAWAVMCAHALQLAPSVCGQGLRSDAHSCAATLEAATPLPDAPLPQALDAGGEDAARTASVHGVVVDKDGAVYEGAHVALTVTADEAPGTSAVGVREAVSDENGRFNFADVPPGIFKLTVTSIGFGTQVVTGTLHVGESYEAKQVVLLMGSTTSEVQVTATQHEIVEAELKEEETQRVLGVIPNFYVSYIPHPSPLSPKQKFSLAWRSSIDPITFISVGIGAALGQANNSYSGYGQGAKGYAKRYGAGYADGFSGTMVGGAILASWWKQDPRYFYKGTGSVRSRMIYAIERSVLCSGDNGKTQVNYSGIIGGLASAGISNLYYPAANRNGAGLTFENLALGAGEGALENLFQEFIVRKLTPHVPKYGTANP